MFVKSPQGSYQAPLFEQFDWLAHGFGTRTSTELEGRLATLRQIHSAVAVHAGNAEGCIGEGDALYSDTPGSLVGVKTADCVPILMVDGRHRAVAAVHAGWRGTIAGVAGAALDAMARRYGTAPSDVYAAIGPAIGVCCYEVGADVAAGFDDLFPERSGLSARLTVDLAEANLRQLAGAGVPMEQIGSARLCTRCVSEEFHSFRRDRERAGRMLSVIGVR